MNEKTINVKRSKVVCTEIRKSPYQKTGTITAILKQQVITTTTYPAAQVGDGISDSLFGANDYSNLGQGSSFDSKSTRVFFYQAPDSIKTKEQMQQVLDAAVAAGKVLCIQRVIANKPVLNPNQERAVKSPNLDATMDTFAKTQVLRYGEGATDKHGNSIAGQLILDKFGQVQYKNDFFFAQTAVVEDENLTHANADVYMSPAIQAEYNTLVGSDDIFGSVEDKEPAVYTDDLPF